MKDVNKTQYATEDVVTALPFGLAFVDSTKQLHLLNQSVQREVYQAEKINFYIDEVLKQQSSIQGIPIERQNAAFLFYFTLVEAKQRGRSSSVLVTAIPLDTDRFYGKQQKAYQELSMDLKAIFDSSYDVIYVSDENGKTLRVSSACERLWGKKQTDLIGKNVRELEQEGIYRPSVTRMVLEKGEKISTIQTTKTGRRLMVVGTPIKDEDGKVVRVVNASRDITEVSQLQAEMDELKRLISGYKQELMQLRSKRAERESIVFNSSVMEKVLELAYRVAQVDSTVLILGESGVGKEVIANYIHRSSQRDKKPFIKINCGAVPENLLESELFGYEKGAFTGANQKGKIGLFEAANDGTLFLDEIGEMSVPLQVKLLRVLQEQEIMRIGGSKTIKINVRIIAATNKNLQEAVHKGVFREDLYYRLNVVPLKISPLRERREDIIPLILHFIDHYNEKYHRQKTFSANLLEQLQHYDWPGNVRELQNIVERLIVISEEQEVPLGYLTDIVSAKYTNAEKVQVLDIMPLKECVEIAEQQLIELAKTRYQSAVKIAEALDVNQSTISRKLKKMNTI